MLVAGPGERLVAPWVPVDRVVPVLQEIRRASRSQGGWARRPGYPSAIAEQYAVIDPPTRRRSHCLRTASRSSPGRPGGGGPVRPRRPCGEPAVLLRPDPARPARPASWSAPAAGEQAGRCLENLAAVCEAAGATLGDAVRLTVYLTDMRAFAEVNEVYGSFFESDPPARVAVAVSALPRGAMVEIDAVVALPGDSVTAAGRARRSSLEDIRRAAERGRRDRARHTGASSHTLSERVGATVALKAENLQRTGSFKLRGALAKLAALGDACATASSPEAPATTPRRWPTRPATRGVTCEVFMPETAPIAKVEAAAALGASVQLVGATVDEALGGRDERADDGGLAFVHPFEDPDVIAGQGTLGLELLEDRSPTWRG